MNRNSVTFLKLLHVAYIFLFSVDSFIDSTYTKPCLGVERIETLALPPSSFYVLVWKASLKILQIERKDRNGGWRHLSPQGGSGGI